jgi:hypothetical protein
MTERTKFYVKLTQEGIGHKLAEQGECKERGGKWRRDKKA